MFLKLGGSRILIPLDVGKLFYTLKANFGKIIFLSKNDNKKSNFPTQINFFKANFGLFWNLETTNNPTSTE